LVANAGFEVVREKNKTSKWVGQGEKVSLIPVSAQEAQFPFPALCKDNIVVNVNVVVLYRFVVGSEEKFSLGYDVSEGEHFEDYSSEAARVIKSVYEPAVKKLVSEKNVDEAVKIANLEATEATTHSKTLSASKVEVISVSFSITPADGKVLAALGAEKSQLLIDAAQAAAQRTKQNEIIRTAALRVADQEQSLAAAVERDALAKENAKSILSEATARADAAKVTADQVSQALKSQIDSFGGNSVAFALHALASSSANVTITSEVMASLQNVISSAKQSGA
jgi:hypothetical protein